MGKINVYDRIVIENLKKRLKKRKLNNFLHELPFIHSLGR